MSIQSREIIDLIPRNKSIHLLAMFAALIAIAALACGETETVVVKETVVVEKEVEVQVEVEKQVTVEVEKVVEVEKEVTVEVEVMVEKEEVAPTAMPEPARQELPETESPAGTLVMIPEGVAPGVGINRSQAPESLMYWGVSEQLFRPNDDGTLVGPWLAESWEITPDGSQATVKIRSGVQFHDGWGELTADDVVYTLDDALFSEGTVAKIAESRIWMDKWVKEDDYTVTMTTVDGEFIPPQWDRSLSNNSSLGGIWSKKVFDDLGPDGAAETPIGTGPFTVNKWVANEEVILDAQESHYRATPSVEQVVIREIPEEATRLAAFRAGEVDISPVSLRFLGSILGETGAHAVETNSSARVTVWYAGNHWIKTDLLTGDPVEPRPAFQPTDEYPWIGDPDDPARMERSAKVRHAMSMAIDRDAINLAILNGLGQVGPNTWYNFSPDDAHWKEEWRDEFKFDPDGAKALLDESGFGPFSIDFFVTPDLPTIVNPQTGEAIAQMWQDNLGITVNIDSTAYSAKRPSLVDRSFIGAYLWTYGSPSPDTPQTYAQRPSVGGWNPGVEIGCVDDTWFSIRAELDLQKRLDANASAQDCLHQYRWATLVVKVPIFAVVAKHVDWQPTTLPGVEAGDFERAVIR
jgi:ABC-type transport system substrate-binding protein